MGELTHFNQKGEAVMVDVSGKADTARTALACGEIQLSPACAEKVKCGEMGKGDVLAVARIAGIMAAKKTPELIPLCHGLNLSSVEISFEWKEETVIKAVCTAKTIGKTGVEMEALTGVQIALLTIYDMCKAEDKGMRMTDIRLLKKTGGKSGVWEADLER